MSGWDLLYMLAALFLFSGLWQYNNERKGKFSRKRSSNADSDGSINVADFSWGDGHHPPDVSGSHPGGGGDFGGDSGGGHH